ncbi:MAG: permease [Xenococcaceae cyanobacterium MO_188.B32]|nr:permease [Xenococcaceae cyanobacterium MO_188.B32]
MVQIHNAFTLFLSLLVEAMPFLLIGVLLSSSLLFLIDERQLITKLPKNPLLGAVVGSCIGFLFPVCECGNVPVARRLLLKGVSPSIAISFLLAAPTINPVVIWSTWIAFGEQPFIVILRVLFSLAIAIFIGFIFSNQTNSQPLLQPTLVKRLTRWQSNYDLNKVNLEQKPEKVSPLLQSGSFLLNRGQILAMDASLGEKRPDFLPLPSKLSKFYLFSENVVQELRELGGMLILGSAIAAIIQVFVPREFVLSLGQNAITSILAMMLLSAIVSICSTVDSFFALSFAATFTSSSLLAFLIFGPMIDIKGIGLMLSVFKPRIIIYIFALAAQLTFILTFIYGYMF